MASSPDDLKKAFKAFKKRMKLTRLDDESRLGHGALTKGGPSGILSIQPPAGYPKEIWDELVKMGYLKYDERGLYTLADRKPG